MKRRKSGGAYRIPPGDRGESVSPTARVLAKCDVGEARAADAVEPGVEETERGHAFRKAVVVQQRNNASHGLYVGRSAGCSRVDDGRRREVEKTHGRRATRAIRLLGLPFMEDHEVERLRSDVGYSAAIRTTQIQSKTNCRSGQVMAVNELKEAVVYIADVLEE